MKSSTTRFLVIFLCVRMAIGCATIMHSSTQDVDIASSPDNAEVWIDGARVGATPTRLTLKRGDTHNVTIKKENFKDVTVKIDKNVSAWIIGNIIFGGIIGCGVDFITGGAYDLAPERLDVNLSKISQYQGQTIEVPLASVDKLKEVRFLDRDGRPEIVVQLTWIN